MRLSEPAIAAIALHADSAADHALESFADSHGPEKVRKNTAFWLGNVRGQTGYERLQNGAELQGLLPMNYNPGSEQWYGVEGLDWHRGGISSKSTRLKSAAEARQDYGSPTTIAEPLGIQNTRPCYESSRLEKFL